MSNSKSLKIGLVLDDSLDSTDGVQQYVITLGQWLTSQGHNVHYLVGRTSRTDIAQIHSLSRNIGVKFNHNRMRMPLPTSRRRLKQFLATEQFDVLHVQTPYSPFLAGRLIRLAPAQTAIIGTFHIVAHSKLVRIANRLLAWWLHRSLQRFQLMLSVSTAAASFAKDVYGLDSQVIPNVVAVQRFQTKPTAVNTTIQVVYLGRLVPRKGCQTLLRALVALQASQTSLPSFQVTIAGRGPLMGQLEQFVADHHLTDQVRFVGFVSEADKPALLAGADITVFPSTGGESFGIVLVEAMASGASVVLAGDNEGYRTVLGDWPATLFDPYNVSALAEKLRYYLEHATERQALAKQLAVTAKRYDVRVVGQAVVVAYKTGLQAIGR